VDFLLERLENTSWSEYITQAGLRDCWKINYPSVVLGEIE
jgi:hypothetical protein